MYEIVHGDGRGYAKLCNKPVNGAFKNTIHRIRTFYLSIHLFTLNELKYSKFWKFYLQNHRIKLLRTCVHAGIFSQQTAML